MKNIIKNTITFLIAIVGFIGGSYWAYQSNWQIEPIILVLASFLEILGFILLKTPDVEEHNSVHRINTNNTNNATNNNSQNVNINVMVDPSQKIESKKYDRTTIIDSMKSRTKILFIDDDKNFNVVKILKDSGWKNTKTVTDIKTLDAPVIKEADILFVDINGVGKLLNLEYEGLDLALMLKQKYENKKVVIYSANKNNNSFHKAWDECDYKLEKNALPYQFQNLVEEYSQDFYSKNK